MKKALHLSNKSFINDIFYSPYYKFSKNKKYRLLQFDRKPNPGMLEAGRQIIDNAHRFPGKSNILLFGDDWTDRPSESGSMLVGDRESDISAAERFGVKGILCDSESGISGVFESILDYVEG